MGCLLLCFFFLSAKEYTCSRKPVLCVETNSAADERDIHLRGQDCFFGASILAGEYLS